MMAAIEQDCCHGKRKEPQNKIATMIRDIDHKMISVHLSEEEAVRNGLAHDEGGHQVLDWSRLPAVRPEHEGVQPPVLFKTLYL